MAANTQTKNSMPSGGITLSGVVETPPEPERDAKAEVKAVDGRPPRPKRRLDEELLDARPRKIPLFRIPGYETYIFGYNPENPLEIQQWIDRGWEEIMPESADPTLAVEENIAMGSKLIGNRCSLGGGIIGIPMKLPSWLYTEDMAKMQKLNDDKIRSVIGKKSLKEEAGDDAFYGEVNITYDR